MKLDYMSNFGKKYLKRNVQVRKTTTISSKKCTKRFKNPSSNSKRWTTAKSSKNNAQTKTTQNLSKKNTKKKENRLKKLTFLFHSFGI